MKLIRVPVPEDFVRRDLHLSSPFSTCLTLCGWVDVPHLVVEGPMVTCRVCCAVVRAAREVPLAALSPSERPQPEKNDGGT